MTKNARVTSAFGAQSTAFEVVQGIDLNGKTALITGGASGLGIETARALASVGARVVIAVRDPAAGDRVAETINRETGIASVSVEQVDLASLASVRLLAKRLGEMPLSILINNAGVMGCPEGRTEDGFETQFGVNHLGHFLLSKLLIPALSVGAPSRVVSLSSSAHMHSDIDLEDPNYHNRPYHAFEAYGQSKTANALFAVELDRRYRSIGLQAFSVMPGVIQTELGRHMPATTWTDLEKQGIVSFKSARQGAATSVWAATSPDLNGYGGLYLEDCAEAQPFSPDLPRGQGVKDFATDPVKAEKLWDLSEKLVARSE